MTKKRKRWIVLGVAALILCIAIVGTYVWYGNSPFPTVVNLMKAARDRDLDGMLDCIEPSKAKIMRRLLDFVGMDAGDLMGKLMPEGGSGFQRESAMKLKFSGYHRDGDRAYMEFAIADRETGTEQTSKIHFIRIEGKWYLELSFGR